MYNQTKPSAPVPVRLNKVSRTSDVFLPRFDKNSHRWGTERRSMKKFVKVPSSRPHGVRNHDPIDCSLDSDCDLPHTQIPHVHHFVDPIVKSPSLEVAVPQGCPEEFEDYDLTDEPCGAVPRFPILSPQECSELVKPSDDLSFDYLKTVCPVNVITLNLAQAMGPITPTQALKLLASSVAPMLGVDAVNHCDICGFVYTCRHLFNVFEEPDVPCSLHEVSLLYKVLVDNGSHLLGVSAHPRQGSSPLEFFSAFLGDPCTHLDDVTPACYYQWCAIRAFVIYTRPWSSTSSLIDAERCLSKYICSILPARAVPQGVMSDIFSQITAACASAWDFVKFLPDFSKRFFSKLQEGLVKSAVDVFIGAISLTNLVIVALSNVFTDVLAKAVESVRATIKEFVPLVSARVLLRPLFVCFLVFLLSKFVLKSCGTLFFFPSLNHPALLLLLVLLVLLRLKAMALPLYLLSPL